MKTHEFADTGTCYDTTQWNEEIADGDLLVVPSEKVVGFLLSAWPIAVTAEAGVLHALTDPTKPPPGDELDAPEDVAVWARSWQAARHLAEQLGYEVAS